MYVYTKNCDELHTYVYNEENIVFISVSLDSIYLCLYAYVYIIVCDCMLCLGMCECVEME